VAALVVIGAAELQRLLTGHHLAPGSFLIRQDAGLPVAASLVAHARRHHHRPGKTESILDMAGMLKAPKGRRVSIEDMNPWR